MRLPGFTRRAKPMAGELEPIVFEPVRRVFRAQVQIRMRKDVSGWVGDKAERRRWALRSGRLYAIDEERAREFVAKGYADFVHPPAQPISDDERAEYEAQVTRVDLGASHG